jgi:hypothetical protein
MAHGLLVSTLAYPWIVLNYIPLHVTLHRLLPSQVWPSSASLHIIRASYHPTTHRCFSRSPMHMCWNHLKQCYTSFSSIVATHSSNVVWHPVVIRVHIAATYTISTALLSSCVASSGDQGAHCSHLGDTLETTVPPLFSSYVAVPDPISSCVATTQLQNTRIFYIQLLDVSPFFVAQHCSI